VKRLIAKQLAITGFLSARVAARRVLVFACALALCGMFSGQGVAQSGQMHAAFDDVHRKVQGEGKQPSGEIRLVSGQQPTAKPPVTTTLTAAKPAKAAQPAATKVTAPATPVRRSPAPRSQPTAEATEPAGEENLPLPPLSGRLTMAGAAPDDGLQLTKNEQNGLITLVVRDKSLSQVLALIAQTQSLNIVASNDIDALISITLRDVPLEQALTAILSVANYTWVKRNNIIMITSLTDATNLPADVQGRQIQVFDLDFSSAAVVAETAKNFLSPIGKISVGATSPTNNRLTQERVVVEDMPDPLARIAAYIAQVDQPPRQVLIEAHVLQVDLDDTTRCGVNLSELIRISGSNLNITTTGFANKNAPQAFLATLDGGDLGGVIELLQTTTDAKTLSSPKLLVLNEQEARLQVGEHTPYETSTTTETSTVQTVQFLDTGTILRLIPRITRDHRVLLHVRPEVSELKETPNSTLPGSKSAELETDVLLEDGQGMIIGGLIKEADTTKQSKVPYLGNVKTIGFLFRKSEVTKTRAEIIIALVPRIQPYDCQYHDFEQGELVKATVPLLHGPLCRTDRPWDPVLPDGKRVSYPLIPKKYRPTGYYHDLEPDYVVPPQPLTRQRMCDDGCAPAAPLPPGVGSAGADGPDVNFALPGPTESWPGSEVISDESGR
jgi:hypothetical protein